MSNQQVVIAYVPVLHKGYLEFFEKQRGKVLFLVGQELLADFPQMRKDIRALPVETMLHLIKSLSFFSDVRILDHQEIKKLQNTPVEITFPEEDILGEIAQKYFSEKKVSFESVFLRWDTKKTLEQNVPNADEEVSLDELDRKLMAKAVETGRQSADWWRQVGAVLVKDEKMIWEAKNNHVPDQQQPYYDGDPRGNFHRGQFIELSTAFHAEAAVIAQAAKSGIALEGCSLYVSTFPCPNCAKLIAYSGIKKVFFQEGYAMVDGETILKEREVKIVRVY